VRALESKGGADGKKAVLLGDRGGAAVGGGMVDAAVCVMRRGKEAIIYKLRRGNQRGRAYGWQRESRLGVGEVAKLLLTLLWLLLLMTTVAKMMEKRCSWAAGRGRALQVAQGTAAATCDAR
jgi:hypothetical protein